MITEIYICPDTGLEWVMNFSLPSGWTLTLPHRPEYMSRETFRLSMKNIKFPEVPEKYKRECLEHHEQLMSVIKSIRVDQ